MYIGPIQKLRHAKFLNISILVCNPLLGTLYLPANVDILEIVMIKFQDGISIILGKTRHSHCVKRVRIWSFSGVYSDRMLEN